MKRVLVAASLTMLASTLTACGGGASSAPKDASKADFCGAYTSVFEDFATVGDDTDALADAMHEWGDKMEEVGTPKGISDEARKGFEVTVEQLGKIEADDLKDAGGQMPEVKVSEGDKKAATAFTTYMTTECAAEIQKATEELVGSMTEGLE